MISFPHGWGRHSEEEQRSERMDFQQGYQQGEPFQHYKNVGNGSFLMLKINYNQNDLTFVSNRVMNTLRRMKGEDYGTYESLLQESVISCGGGDTGWTGGCDEGG